MHARLTGRQVGGGAEFSLHLPTPALPQVRCPRAGHSLPSPHAVVLAASFQGLTHPFADGHSFLGHGLGVSHVVFHDGLEELILILAFEGRLRDRGQ